MNDRVYSLVNDILIITKEWQPAIIDEINKPPQRDRMTPFFFTWKSRDKKRKKVRIKTMACDETLKKLHIRIKSLCELILKPYTHETVYSYIRNKSTADCAACHIGAKAVFGIDITDFFFSFTFNMLFELFHTALLREKEKSGLSEKKCKTAARVIATLCTVADPRDPEQGQLVMPIGIQPTGHISNAIPLELDTTIIEYIQPHGLRYSRYSDNLYISSSDGHIPREVQAAIIGFVENFTYAGDTPFHVKPEKTSYRPYWRHQRILGVCVNEKVNVPKSRERWLRSALAHLYKDAVALRDDIAAGTIDPHTAKTTYQKLERKSMHIYGRLSAFAIINRDKYTKYISWRYAITFVMTAVFQQIEYYTSVSEATDVISA